MCTFVPKYPSLRKRRMGKATIGCFNRIADILDKDHKMPKGKTKNNRTPSWCTKGLVACRDTTLGVCFKRYAHE